jgi:hypothetical protein
MTQPNPVRTLESHAVTDQTGEDGRDWSVCPGYDEHYMFSVKTNSSKVPFVEICARTETCGWIDGASLDWWADNAVKSSLTARAGRIAVASETNPFQFVQGSDQDLTLQEILGQALGAASMCWDPKPESQVFESTRAAQVYRALQREVDRALTWGRKGALDLAYEMYALLCNSSPEESFNAGQRHRWHQRFQNLKNEFHMLSGINPGDATVKADATTDQEEPCTASPSVPSPSADGPGS